MKEIILFSLLSFVLILFGCLYVLGVVTIGPIREPEVKSAEPKELIAMQLATLDAQRKSIETRRAGLEGRAGDLDLEKRMIAAERARLQSMLDSLETSARRLTAARSSQVAKVAKLYEVMKPEDAASIAASIDLDLLISIVAAMKDKQAAKMLAALPPKLAADITKRLGTTGAR